MLIYACSTKVNKFPNRAYHSVNTKFNVLFNGQQSFLAGMEKVNASHTDDYDEPLDIFIYTNDSTARNIYPEMDTAIKKTEKAIQRHSMYIKKQERNKYIDDSYLLMGKAYFYKRNFPKTFELFKYLYKAYKDEDIGQEAKLWTAIAYIEKKNWKEADKLLQEIEGDKDFPDKLRSQFKAVYADYYYRNKNYALAITELKEAVETTKKKEKKIRYTFIIAQYYEKLGNNALATQYYDEVLELKPPYEIALNAKARKAVSSEASQSIKETEEQLLKLLRRSPPGNQKSKIYMALAELELKRGKFKKAKNYISEAIVNAEDNNTKKKAYFKMASYYYDSRDYINAEAYFDSTYKVTNSLDKDYETISSKRNNLGRLVKNLEVINREDSLRNLAGMSEQERLQAIQNQIAANKKRLEEAKKKQEIEALQKANTNNGLNSGGSNGKWYFYNPPAKDFGVSEFKKIWGDRKLEDNWRRKNKSTSSFESSFTDINETDVNADNVENIDTYLEAIPLTDEKLRASVKRSAFAYYDLGIVYMEKLNEKELSVEEGFDLVLQNYDTSKLAPPSAYYAYNIYKDKEYTDKMNHYKNILLNKYPQSEYALIVKDPEYFIKKQKEADAIYPAYEKAYDLYIAQNYNAVILEIEDVLQRYPDNKIQPKFMLLKSLALRGDKQKEPFIANLNAIVKDYPKSEEAEVAKDLLNKVNDPNYFKKEQPDLIIKGTETPFSKNDSTTLQCAIAFPLNGENKASDFKIGISNFNRKYFSLNNLKLSDLIIKDGVQMILIRDFENEQEAIDYVKTFKQNKKELTGINDKGFYFFIISDENLGLLIKNKDLDLYDTFFRENYSL